MAGTHLGFLPLEVAYSLEKVKHCPPHCACTVRLLPEHNVSPLGGRKEHGLWSEAQLCQCLPELCGLGRVAWRL